jgi:hypothetical protein
MSKEQDATSSEQPIVAKEEVTSPPPLPTVQLQTIGQGDMLKSEFAAKEVANELLTKIQTVPTQEKTEDK